MLQQLNCTPYDAVMPEIWAFLRLQSKKVSLIILKSLIFIQGKLLPQCVMETALLPA